MSAGGNRRRPDGSDGGWDPAADAWLIDKARGGDVDAFEVLVQRHRGRVYRIALRILGNTEDAEDVAQDALVQAWAALSSFVGSSAFSTWLYRIVVNRCLLHVRRRRRTEPLREDQHPSVPGPENTVVARQRADATLAAMRSLPSEQLSALVLHQFEGLSHRECGEILNVSEGAVRNRLARARRTLSHQMRGGHESTRRRQAQVWRSNR